MKSDARVDQYIAKAPAFAKPILKEVRARVGRACPDALETIKWNVPFFVLGDKLLASMAAFKKHAKIGVWTGMKPNMRDFTVVGELPAAKAFEQEVKAAAAAIAGGGAKKKAPAKKAPANEKTAVAETRPSDEIRTALSAFVANAVAAGGSGEVKLAPPASVKALKKFAKYPPRVRDGLSEVFAGLSAHISCTWDLAREDKARALQGKVGFYGDIDLSPDSVDAIDASDFAVKDDVWDDKLSLIDTGSGDMVAMDLTPKGAGQVVYLSHDLDPADHGKVIAPTFAEFVRRWVALGCFALDGGTFRHFCSPSHRYLDAASPFGRKWLAAVGVEAETKTPATKKAAQKAPRPQKAKASAKRAPARKSARKKKPKKA